MKTIQKERHPRHQWISVEQLRAGDTVEVEPDRARVIMVEKTDPAHVLVAYEGRDPVDYPVATRLRINARPSACSH
jgi:hypothetical protein